MAKPITKKQFDAACKLIQAYVDETWERGYAALEKSHASQYIVGATAPRADQESDLMNVLDEGCAVDDNLTTIRCGVETVNEYMDELRQRMPKPTKKRKR